MCIPETKTLKKNCFKKYIVTFMFNTLNLEKQGQRLTLINVFRNLNKKKTFNKLFTVFTEYFLSHIDLSKFSTFNIFYLGICYTNI